MQNRLLFAMLIVVLFVFGVAWKLNARLDSVESKTEKTVDDAFRKVAATLSGGAPNAGAQAASATTSGAPPQNQAAGSSLSGVDEFAQALCRLRNGGNCSNPQQTATATGAVQSSGPATGQTPGLPSGAAVTGGNRSLNLDALTSDADAVVEAANKLRRSGNKLCDPMPMPTMPMLPGQ